MSLVGAGIDLGGSSVKGWIADEGGRVFATASAPTPTLLSGGDRVEFDPSTLWSVVSAVLSEALRRAGLAGNAVSGVTVSSLRQGFVLVGDDGEIGPGLLNSDRSGAAQLDPLRERIGAERLYATTGHWPAPELTLPKLLHIADTDPERWSAVRRLLFVHDWIIWKLSGVMVSEISLICAGQMADVAKRTWAHELLAELDIPAKILAPPTEAGTVVGAVTREAARSIPGLVAGTPIIIGGSDSQMTAMGMGGLVAGTASVVAGSSTPVQVATSSPLEDPKRGPWVSTHLRNDLWAAEGNAGYPGTLSAWWSGISGQPQGDHGAVHHPGANGLTAVVSSPIWGEEYWAVRPQYSLVGFTGSTTACDIAEAILEAHAFGIRSNLEQLGALLPEGVDRILLGGGAAAALSTILPNVLNRPVDVVEDQSPAALAGVSLIGRALGGQVQLVSPTRTVVPDNPEPYDVPYARYLDAHEEAHSALARSKILAKQRVESP